MLGQEVGCLALLRPSRLAALSLGTAANESAVRYRKLVAAMR